MRNELSGAYEVPSNPPKQLTRRGGLEEDSLPLFASTALAQPPETACRGWQRSSRHSLDPPNPPPTTLAAPDSSPSSSAPPPLPPTSHDGYISPDWVVPPVWPNDGSSTSHRSKRSRMTNRRRASLSTLSSASSSPSGPADSDDSDSDAYSDSSWNTEQEELEAQLQWEESVRQLQALVNLVAVPWVSRYFGRKWAYWLFERYLNIGLGKRFWLGPLSTYAPQAWR